MNFEIAGKSFEIRKEPLTEDVERVLEYEQGIILSLIDMNTLKEEDKKRDITELMTQQLTMNPDKLRKYIVQQKLTEPLKTIILCTGADPGELKKLPLRPIYLKCKEALGGSASDFFEELGMNTITIPNQLPAEKPEQ